MKLKKLKNGRVMLVNSYGQFHGEITPEIIEQFIDLIFEDEKNKIIEYFDPQKLSELQNSIKEDQAKKYNEFLDEKKFEMQFEKILQDKYAWRVFGWVFIFLFINLILHLINFVLIFLKN